MVDQEMYLHEMGLSEYEASAYLALLQTGKATAKEVATAGDIPQSRVYDVLEKLERKGFVISQPGRPKKFGTVEPERAIRQFGEYKEKKFEAEYENVMNAGEEFVDSVHASPPATGTADEPDIVWSYHTEHQLFEVFERLCRGATDEIRMVTRADSIERKVGRLDEMLGELDEQGVRIRVLIPRSQQVRDVVVERLAECADVRRATHIDAQIYLFDGDAVLIAFMQDQQYVGLTVRNRALGETLNHLFEVLWANCA